MDRRASDSLHLVLEDDLEGVGHELVPISLVELVLELDPMESQSVQEAFQGVHAHQNAERSREEAKP